MKKEYTKPELKIEDLELEDIMLGSGVGDQPGSEDPQGDYPAGW